MSEQLKEAQLTFKDKIASFWDKANWGIVKIDVSENHDGSDIREVRKRDQPCSLQ